MKHIALASLLAMAVGCSEPKAPPPGADTGPMEAPKIDMPTDNPASTPAPKDSGATTGTSTEKDSADGEPQEK